MSKYFTEEDVLVRVAPLTRQQLGRFVAARVVQPADSPEGRVFRQVDVARLELLCELSDALEIPDETLGVVMSLVDQLHGVRAELKAVMQALEKEPDEVRARVVETVWVARAAPRSD